MIILFHPRATKPRNCRLPLAVLALAAVLEGREEYRIIDGNLEEDPTAAILSTINLHQVELLGVSCMPGPQMVAAMETCANAPAFSSRWCRYKFVCPAEEGSQGYFDYLMKVLDLTASQVLISSAVSDASGRSPNAGRMCTSIMYR